MSKPLYTPGPWEADDDFIVQMKDGTKEIATANQRLRNWRENARLIALAPELHRTLVNLYNAIILELSANKEASSYKKELEEVEELLNKLSKLK